MALKDRLKTLKRQTGQIKPEMPATGLADRVSRLRSNAGAPLRSRAATTEAAAVAESVGGELIGEGLICIEKHLPLSRVHGRVPLSRVLEDHGGLPEADGLDVREAVFFDTETTGLSGGTGTVVFLLGLGRLAGEMLVVRQYLITSFAAERAMLKDAGRWLEGTRALVSFNGKSFDQPLLTARARLSGVSDPFSGLRHLDLLHATRRAFGKRWADCRLATTERELLQFGRIDDLPGCEAPEAWFAYLHRGDASRLPGVAKHNHWDIVSLAALLPALADVHSDPRLRGADVLAIARSALKTGNASVAYELLREAASELEEAGLLELARLHRGRGEWEQARVIWERLAGAGCSEAVERLAKYYEHELHDWEKALAFARRLPASREREHRCRRLEEKLERQGGGLDIF